MIEDAVAKIRAIGGTSKDMTRDQLRARLTIRGCLRELRTIAAQFETGPVGQPAH